MALYIFKDFSYMHLHDYIQYMIISLELLYLCNFIIPSNIMSSIHSIIGAINDSFQCEKARLLAIRKVHAISI